VRLHHIAVTVTDLDASVLWYREVLGLEEERRISRADLGVEVVFLSASTVRLELFRFQDGAPVPQYRREVDCDIRVGGTKHIAFEVDDVAATVSRAKAAGSVYVDGPNSSFDGKNVYAFVADPSGVPSRISEVPVIGDQVVALSYTARFPHADQRSPRLSGVLEPVCSEKAAPRKSVSADQEISKGYGIFRELLDHKIERHVDVRI